ncbi:MULTISPECIES: MaoC family dehydratase [Vibrio]|uniref:MaoC family dehydratase n=1 Tax=Vibrio TaxID=662 RepID=UPI000E6997F0|nr:MaoC family dehydratase [Vibrio sp. PID23_8]RIZ53002.1 acyl dehydratase [Vibrio sp. PID23_8]
MISKKNNRISEINVGDNLPELSIPITVALITGGALATRDYFPGHHDKDAAQASGTPHIFMNILTTNALVQRYVEEWAGNGARLKDLKIKLGMPNYPGDTMLFKGEVTHIDSEANNVVVSIAGKNSMGTHVSGTVLMSLPA